MLAHRLAGAGHCVLWTGRIPWKVVSMCPIDSHTRAECVAIYLLTHQQADRWKSLLKGCTPFYLFLSRSFPPPPLLFLFLSPLLFGLKLNSYLYSWILPSFPDQGRVFFVKIIHWMKVGHKINSSYWDNKCVTWRRWLWNFAKCRARKTELELNESKHTLWANNKLEVRAAPPTCLSGKEERLSLHELF